MLLCIAEDRPSEEVAVRLLLLSIREHEPEARVHVTYPPASEGLRRWIEGQPNIALRTEPLEGAYGWNVKPHAVLEALSRGAERVTWIDADIVLAGPIGHLFPEDERAMVVTEDTWWGQHPGGTHRTRAWGFEVGRRLHATVNSGVFSVTAAHAPLLERWKGCLESPEYREVQSRPPLERPIHMLGDQEVLTALLGAREFADLPVRWLRRGVDIIQNFGPAGYTIRERVRNLRAGRTPPIVHSMGNKPWHFPDSPAPWESPRGAYDALHVELSPYRRAAERYASDLDDDQRWLHRRSPVGRILRGLTRANPHAMGLPLALVDSGVRLAKRAANLDRYPTLVEPD